MKIHFRSFVPFHRVSGPPHKILVTDLTAHSFIFSHGLNQIPSYS